MKDVKVEVGDVVLVRWKGNYLLHLILQLRSGEALIGNNVGATNGWVPTSALRGKVVVIDD